jgi:hypothetical protein
MGIRQKHGLNSAEKFTSNNLETHNLETYKLAPCSLGDCNIMSFMRQERGAEGDFGNPGGQIDFERL